MTASDALPYAAFAAILAMAAATQLMRLGGFWLMGHVPITPRVRRMLEALPGSVVVALVLPVVVKTGPTGYLAVGAVIVSMLLRRNEFLAVAIGIAVATLCRWYGL
jgi:uncharacterized membrane protein